MKHKTKAIKAGGKALNHSSTDEMQNKYCTGERPQIGDRALAMHDATPDSVPGIKG